MEDIGLLCDSRFAILCSEPGGEELVSFRYAIAHNSSDENEGEINAQIRWLSRFYSSTSPSPSPLSFFPAPCFVISSPIPYSLWLPYRCKIRRTGKHWHHGTSHFIDTSFHGQKEPRTRIRRSGSGHSCKTGSQEGLPSPFPPPLAFQLHLFPVFQGCHSLHAWPSPALEYKLICAIRVFEFWRIVCIQSMLSWIFIKPILQPDVESRAQASIYVLKPCVILWDKSPKKGT